MKGYETMIRLMGIAITTTFLVSCGISSFKSTKEIETEEGGADAAKGGEDLPASSDDLVVDEGDNAVDLEAIAGVKQEYVVGTALFEGCKDPTKIQTLQQNLNFKERQDCSFGMGDNLPIKNNFVTARESQTIKADLPPDSVVCDIRMESEQADLHYDDFLFITLNNDILVASEVGFGDLFAPVNGLKPWDWEKIKGKPFSLAQGDTKGVPYCLNDPECKVPGHDMVGAFKYSVDIEGVPALAAKVINQQSMDFTVIATGDDNAGDCDHSTFNLNLTVEYVPIP